MGLIIRNKFTVKATEISKIFISSGAVRFPITSFRHPVGFRKLLCRQCVCQLAGSTGGHSLMIFGSAIQDVELSPTSSKKNKQTKKPPLLSVIPKRLRSVRFLITKLMWKYVYLQNGYSGHANRHSGLQKHFQCQSETDHEMILMQIREITQHDFWIVLCIYASRCCMFNLDPIKNVFELEKVKAISLIYFSFRENRVQFLFKFCW